jgi:hypothetical protein
MKAGIAEQVLKEHRRLLEKVVKQFQNHLPEIVRRSGTRDTGLYKH